jgi:hypothetical protein
VTETIGQLESGDLDTLFLALTEELGRMCREGEHGDDRAA